MAGNNRISRTARIFPEFSGGLAPGARRGGSPTEVGEVARLSAERLLHAVGETLVASVQRFTADAGEDIGNKLSADLGHGCVKLIESDRDVANRIAQITLAEILSEPGRADQRVIQTAGLDDGRNG